MYAPTPIAPKIPMFWAPDAVPRMTLTRPRVSMASIRNASNAEYPDCAAAFGGIGALT
jgi:hypothetical protein